MTTISTRAYRILCNVESAQKKANDEIKKLLPIGTELRVQISHKTWIDFRVTGHGQAWWHEPTQVHGVNMDTGKRRKFVAGSELHPFQIIKYGKAAPA